jgi:arginine/lysine/ornithine decarboxylase
LGLTGQEAERILRHELKVQCELSDAANLLFLITFADDDATVSKLLDALVEIKRLGDYKIKRSGDYKIKSFSQVELTREISMAALSPRETFYSPVEVVELKKSVGRICAEEITFYPPGIPLLMPGEKISAQVVKQIEQEKFSRVIGAVDKTLSTIKVVKL